jgi:hypothetical protein
MRPRVRLLSMRAKGGQEEKGGEGGRKRRGADGVSVEGEIESGGKEREPGLSVEVSLSARRGQPLCEPLCDAASLEVSVETASLREEERRTASSRLSSVSL